LGPGGQLEGLAKVVDAVPCPGRMGDGDPTRGPQLPHPRLAAQQRRRRGGEQETAPREILWVGQASRPVILMGRTHGHAAFVTHGQAGGVSYQTRQAWGLTNWRSAWDRRSVCVVCRLR